MSLHTFHIQRVTPGTQLGPDADYTTVSKRNKPKSPIKCSVCSKVFKRNEHLARHELSHTNKKPFGCQFCKKAYARRDLVKRHEKTIHADLYYALNESGRKLSQVDQSIINELDARMTDSDSLSAPQETTNGLDVAADFAASCSSKPNAARSAAHRLGRPKPLGEAGFSLEDPPPQSVAQAFHSSRVTKTGPRRSPAPSMPSTELDISMHDSMTPLAGQNALLGGVNHVCSCGAGEIHDVNQWSPDKGSHMPDCLNARALPVPTLSPIMSDGFDDFFGQSDFTDINLMMGDVSNEFFFQQIAERGDQFLDRSGIAGHVSGVLHDSGTSGQQHINASPSAQSSGMVSEGGSERSTRTRLPMILRERSEHAPHLTVDEAAFRALTTDAHQRLGTSETSFPVKSRHELQNFLNGYLDCFHRHLPILHLPTLDLTQTPSPLILAMACIGALYRLQRQKARQIYLSAARASDVLPVWYQNPSLERPGSSVQDQEPNSSSNTKPLWLMQARVLVLLYAVLGSDDAIMQSELDRLGIFVTDYRTRRFAISAKLRQERELTWREWVEIEASKRLMCAMFICSSLIMVVYDVAPGVGITQDLEIPLLEEEKLWNAATDDSWQALRDVRSPTLSTTRTIRSVMADMLDGKIQDDNKESPYFVSGFTALVIIHALNTYAWTLSQFSDIHASPFSSLSGATPDTLLTNALKKLATCHEILQLARPDGIESFWNIPEGPLLLNCEAMLRVAYTRLFLYPSMPEGLVLFCSNSQERTRLLRNFVAAPQERTPRITKVMTSMCEAFSVPARAGYMLVQKTAAITWSVEHAVAGWGCVLLLSKWAHRLQLDMASEAVPPNEMEMAILSQIKTALDGMETTYDEKDSLAAAIVSSWAPLMTDVWVWGVTTKLGAMMSDLIQIYRSSYQQSLRR